MSNDLNKIDFDALGLYCAAWSKWREADTQVKEHGSVIADRRGDLKKSPWLQISNDATREMRSLQDRLGLHPVSRAKIKAQETVSIDPKWADLDGAE